MIVGFSCIKLQTTECFWLFVLLRYNLPDDYGSNTHYVNIYWMLGIFHCILLQFTKLLSILFYYATFYWIIVVFSSIIWQFMECLWLLIVLFYNLPNDCRFVFYHDTFYWMSVFFLFYVIFFWIIVNFSFIVIQFTDWMLA